MKRALISKRAVQMMDLALRMCGISAEPAAIEGLAILMKELSKRGGKFTLRHAAKITAHMNQIKSKNNEQKQKTSSK